MAPGKRVSIGRISTEGALAEFIRDQVSLPRSAAMRPHCRVYNNADLTIPTGVATALTFNSERWDKGTLTEQHSITSNTSRLTCQVPGLYSIGANVRFQHSGTGMRAVALRVNNVAIADVADDAGTITQHEINVNADYRLAVGDYAEVVVYHTAGGDLKVEVGANWSPEFWWHGVSV